jgi:DnaJ-class molecular chaperone
MAERTKRELSKVYQDAMFKRHKEGDPDRTYVSDCQEAGQRACYELGASDARAALEAENAGLRARVERALRVADSLDEQPSQACWAAAAELRAALTASSGECPGCKSSGFREYPPPTGRHICDVCNGSGEEYLGASAGNIHTCRTCHGTGRTAAGGGEAGGT